LPRLERDQIRILTAALYSEECVERVLREIEQLHRVVFHANERVDWDLVRRSAEQILIAEIASRHGGDPLGIFLRLRALEDSGKSWDAAIHELAVQIHSYFTTPLGIVMRQDMFGDEVVFITPDAYEWTAKNRGRAKGT
jgi:hypothetical protein